MLKFLAIVFTMLIRQLKRVVQELIYVKQNLKTVARPDIKLLLDDVESCWVEIESDSHCNSN